MTTSILLLLVALFVIGIFLRLDFTIYVAYVLGAVYLLARLWTRRSLHAIGFQRHHFDHAFLGEKVKIKVEIWNKGLLPIPWLRFEDALPVGLSASPLRIALSLGPRQRVHFTYEIAGHKRGVYPLGPAIFRSGDLFGFEAPQEIRRTIGRITIYPMILPIADIGLPSRSPFGTIRSKVRFLQDTSRVIGVRDYHPGDSLRHINWKVSARQHRLHTRVFEPATSLDTVILLNLNRQDYERIYRIDATERGIVVAASVAHHLIQRRQAVGLYTNGQDSITPQRGALKVPASSGRAGLMRILETLARVKTVDTLPFTSFLRRETSDLPWGITLLVITGMGDHTLLQELHLFRRKGYDVALICVEAGLGFSLLRRQAEAWGIPAYQVTRLPNRALNMTQPEETTHAIRTHARPAF